MSLLQKNRFDPDGRAEALEWLLRLQEAPEDKALQAQFELWRAQPDHAAAWDEAARLYVAIGDHPPRYGEMWEGQALLSAPVAAARRKRARGRQSLRPRKIIAGLTAAAAVLVMALVGPEMVMRLTSDHMTGVAQTHVVSLEDGSRIHLAPQSALSVQITDTARQIRLHRGQAFFEVTPDATRPFSVTTGGAEARVLGTAFDVHRDGTTTTVAVEHGRVQVTADDGHRAQTPDYLTAGEFLRLGTDGKIDHGQIVTSDVAAWRDGQFSVQNRPVAEVIEALRPWYGGVILTPSDRLLQARVTGVYNLNDPLSALEALGQASGGKVFRVSPWVIIVY